MSSPVLLSLPAAALPASSPSAMPHRRPRFVVVEVAQQLAVRRSSITRSAVSRQAPRLWCAAALRLDVAHDVIHVDIVAARRDVFGILFLELVRFGFFVHARELCRFTMN